MKAMRPTSKSRMKPARNRRVVFIAFPFPPSRGAGVYRTVATVNFLISEGWDVTVIAPEESYFRRYQGSEDLSLLSWVSPSAKVVRVPLNNWARNHNLADFSMFRAAFPRVGQRWIKTLTKYLSPLEGYPFWLFPSLAAGLRSSVRGRPDVILATGNPFNSFVVAAALGRLMRTPYVLDYRDAWTFDQFTGDLKPGAADVALSLEGRVLARSAGVVSVNDAILTRLRDSHALDASVPTVVAENGYDREFGSNSKPSGRRDGAEARFVHVGTLVPGKMDWPAVLGEFDMTAKQMDLPVSLDIYGHLGFSREQARGLTHLFESSSVVRYKGAIERHSVAALYDDADALYLPLYDSPFVTSGKIYEMMATGKPILAWGSRTAGAMVPLGGYPKLIRASRSQPKTWARAMRAAIELARGESPVLDERALAYASRYERVEQLRPLGALLQKVARKP